MVKKNKKSYKLWKMQFEANTGETQSAATHFRG